MKNEFIAIPVFNDRVSPLLDEARRFMLLEVADNAVLQKLVVGIDADSAFLRMVKLREIGITAVICGAVSGYLARIAGEQGFTLYSWLNGPVDDIVDLYLDNKLTPALDCGKPCRGSGRSCGRESGVKIKKIKKEGNNL